ncbi:hypothetical protein BU14_0165s0013 [Porphyra umbilicalis]|uniref:NADH dehydrogenase [ubiquinone] iron-sulfur protein 5 n=1 Tax=Porphyra umbilicalis TaxID=2786 RepID=A0A1X6P804_PORUM|nr:hypothetical protein BU14_0165s0013 [Porphyra umbilicalis]|eukprot:OSX77019.1 hypothetical protein BU14_0165s0013 [Porphyra umbilicalis]
MASGGVGTRGTSGRCYSLWMDYSQCVDDAAVPTACLDVRDDYIECLHHYKEFMRMKVVAAEMVAKGLKTVGEKPPPSAATPAGHGGGGH